MRKPLSVRAASASLRFGLVALVAAGIGAAVLSAPSPARADDAPALTVWVSPAGSDAADGLTEQTPFATLQQAGDWLCGSTTECAGRGEPVIVRIAQTQIHVTAATTWRYFDPDYPTTFEPWSYQPGDTAAQVAAAGGLPTFDGGFAVDHGLVFAPAGAGNGSTRLTFVNLRWQRFNVAAVEILGGIGQVVTGAGITVTQPLENAANGVTFDRDYFYQVGNRWTPSHPMGFGAIEMINSSADVVTNSQFIHLENSETDAGHVHAIYLAHGSSDAVVSGNTFTDITGDVVRERDRSERTLVTKNVFTRAGQYGFVDDWYCRPNISDAICAPKEYRSWDGVFVGNTLHGLYPEKASYRGYTFCFDLLTACPTSRWTRTAPKPRK